VGDVVAGLRAFSAYLADFGHGVNSYSKKAQKRYH
jgi:hypothetical protein